MSKWDSNPPTPPKGHGTGIAKDDLHLLRDVALYVLRIALATTRSTHAFSRGFDTAWGQEAGMRSTSRYTIKRNIR